MPNLNEVLYFLATTHQIVCKENLTLGNVVKTVFRATRGKDLLVVKIGLSDRAAKEVLLNRKGYDELRSIGAHRLLPNPLFNLDYKGVPVVIMEDCGPDFYHASRAERNPVTLFKQLVETMELVYSETRRPYSGEGQLRYLRAFLVYQYEVYLHNNIDRELIDEIRNFDISCMTIPLTCFSSFDFTPEDVFVGSFGVKYVDPLPNLLGMPAIDLACFAGVALDAHGLPGSKDGYTVLEDFAVHKVSKILGVTENVASCLFSFGRALQSALSARFRLLNEPHRVPVLCRQSEAFARKFLSV